MNRSRDRPSPLAWASHISVHTEKQLRERVEGRNGASPALAGAGGGRLTRPRRKAPTKRVRADSTNEGSTQA
eukprot:scaffold20028_cov106-Isochrysis_galbana.AAC.5